MALADKNGNVVMHTPTDGEVLLLELRNKIKAQAERVKADRQGEEARTLQRLKDNAETCNRINYEPDPIKVFDVACSEGCFFVMINRAVGMLTDNDRDHIEDGVLMSLIAINRTENGSLLVYKFAADVEKH